MEEFRASKLTYLMLNRQNVLYIVTSSRFGRPFKEMLDTHGSVAKEDTFKPKFTGSTFLGYEFLDLVFYWSYQENNPGGTKSLRSTSTGSSVNPQPPSKRKMVDRPSKNSIPLPIISNYKFRITKLCYS